MSQQPCPNCGGYKYSIKTNYVSKKPIPIGLKIFGLSMTFCGFIYIFLTSSGDKSSIWIFGILGLIAIFIWSSMKTNKPTGYEFVCDICGYTWDWFIGNSWPDVKVQPNLIALGSRRLEQQRAAIPCKACGNTIPEGYAYCPYCGASRL